MKQQNLLISTILLTISSLLVRTIGMISMMFLSQILGSEGIGIYELMISLYMTAVIFGSAGLSASVSRMAAEALGKNKKASIFNIMVAAFSFALTAGLISAICLFIAAPWLADCFIQSQSVVSALRILSFSIPLIACSSCFKGYFYATRRTIYPASSDVLEQCVKLTLILILVKYYAPLGIRYTYQATATALTFGECFSFSYLCTLFILESKAFPKSHYALDNLSQTLKKLLGILLPIALISYIGYLFMAMENLLIPRGLKQFGQSFSASMSLYGVLKGMVLPIIFFPSAFLTAFSTTLIPEISRANALGQKGRVKGTTQRVLQLTFILSILVVSIFLTYGNELGFVLYKTEAIGPMLQLLALTVPFIYTEVIADGILKGLDAQVSCLRYSLTDAVLRVLLLYLLLPFKGVNGLMGIMVFSSIFTSSLNFNKLLSVTHVTLRPVNYLLKPAIAAAFASSYSRLILNQFFRYSLGLTTKVILGILLMIIMYLPLLFLIKTISLQDLQWLKKQLSLAPIGEKTA